MSSIAKSSMPMCTIGSLAAAMTFLATAPNVQDVHCNTTLWNKLVVLIYDVHNYHTSPTSYARLAQAAKSPYHLGLPYLTPSEVEFLTSVELNHGVTLGDKIKSAIHTGNQRRQELIDINGVAHYNPSDCPAFDLATVLEEKFVIRGNQLRISFNIHEVLIECGFSTDHPLQEGARKIPSCPPLFHQMNDKEI